MSKLISISLSPNVRAKDLALASKLMLRPGKYLQGNSIAELERTFKLAFKASGAWSLNSGRSALLTLLRGLKFPAASEVLLQAFTCNAVGNPILWAGLRPVYVDIDETFNLSPDDLEKKITPQSKAVIVQHTFGVPAQIEKIKAICEQHKLILIEDLAHGLGSSYQGKALGTFGDFAFLSFGRDKVISSVYGGLLLSNNPAWNEQINKVYAQVKMPSRRWTLQQIWHPLWLRIILPTYRSSFGKALLLLLQKSHLLSLAVQKSERQGKKPSFFPARLPNALAALALSQYQDLGEFTAHRRATATLYTKLLAQSDFILPNIPEGTDWNAYRYTIRHPEAHKIIRRAWRQNLLLGDWYTNILVPRGTDLAKLGYRLGTCPVAEQAAHATLNLPTHINISEKDLKEIVDFLLARRD